MTTKRHGIKTEEGDAVEFIQQVNSVLESIVSKYDIGEVVYLKIKNWFDHKWLGYSGKSIVYFDAAGHRDLPDAAFESVWRDKLTVPPLNPHRVIYSRYFRMKDTGNSRIEKPIQKYQFSADNIHNRITDYTKDGLLLWFSSNTKTNQKGSLMVYTSQNDRTNGWYALLENVNGWRVTKAKGIDVNAVQSLANG